MATAAIVDDKIQIDRVLQRGFETIGRNLLPFAALALLFGAFPKFLELALVLRGFTAGPLGVFATPYYWAFMLLSLVLGSLLEAAIVRMAILDLGGQDPSPMDSLMEALKLILPILAISILSGLIIVLGAVLLIVPGIIAYVSLIVSIPVLVQERRGVIGSMGRSQELTSGSRWRILGVVLILWFAGALVSAAVGVVATATSFGSLWVPAAFQALGGAVIALISAAVTSSLYVELKTVREGATTDSLAAIFA